MAALVPPGRRGVANFSLYGPTNVRGFVIWREIRRVYVAYFHAIFSGHRRGSPTQYLLVGLCRDRENRERGERGGGLSPRETPFHYQTHHLQRILLTMHAVYPSPTNASVLLRRKRIFFRDNPASRTRHYITREIPVATENKGDRAAVMFFQVILLDLIFIFEYIYIIEWFHFLSWPH